MRKELGLQELFKNYCQLLDEKAFTTGLDSDSLKLVQARENYFQQIKTSKIMGVIDIFLRILSNDDDELRVFGFKAFTDIFTKVIREQTIEVYDSYLKAAERMQQNSSEETRSQFYRKKLEYSESVVTVNHLWREISHIYAGNPRRPRSKVLPILAAQHLLDGFPIELQDGDSGHLNERWLDAVFEALANKIGNSTVFVASVIGVQSAGKSTLLNTMFGTKFRCGDGMCTRGINMQLCRSKYSSSYDYVIVLDTEGLRAPEFAGLKFSDNRDNKMATMSIIPSDTTIMMTVGDDDSAVKDILPIVLRAYQSSSIAEESGLSVKPQMTVLYKVNNATCQSFNSTLNERLSLVESLRTAQEIINEVGVIGDSMEDSVFDSVMSLNPNSDQKTNLRQNSFCSFININTGDSEFEGNIRFIGQLQNSPNPPDDKPEPSYGKRITDIRKYIHQQMKEKNHGPKKLLDWWALMKDVSSAMSTMDFNFNFKNAVQLRTYNQLKNAEKKLKKELERKLSDVTDRLEKLAQNKAVSLTEIEKNDMVKIDSIIGDLVEDHKHDLGVVMEDYSKLHEGLINEKQFSCLSVNKVSFLQNWTRGTARMLDTKGYLFKRFITNILKYKNILGQYEKAFRANLREAWEENRAVIENPDEYRRFFDSEFEKFHNELKTESTNDIDVKGEISKRFIEYETNLESNDEKVNLKIYQVLAFFVQF